MAAEGNTSHSHHNPKDDAISLFYAFYLCFQRIFVTLWVHCLYVCVCTGTEMCYNLTSFSFCNRMSCRQITGKYSFICKLCKHHCVLVSKVQLELYFISQFVTQMNKKILDF